MARPPRGMPRNCPTTSGATTPRALRAACQILILERSMCVTICQSACSGRALWPVGAASVDKVNLGALVAIGKGANNLTHEQRRRKSRSDRKQVLPSLLRRGDERVTYEGDAFAIGRPRRHIDGALTAEESREHPDVFVRQGHDAEHDVFI